MIISRDMPGLQKCPRIKLDPDLNSQVANDIERYITARVHKMSSVDGVNTELSSHVQSTLLERAKGTFLWVGFAMFEMLQKRT